MGAKRRSAQPQQAAGFSDYDTETAAPVPNDLPAPQWNVSSLNEAVLKRHIPDLEKIERIAPFTVVYHFSPDSQGWEKVGCEGTLFLCRMPGQRYSVIVLNRKSLDNFSIDLISGDDIELTSDYIILQRTGEDGVPEIIGLWVFNVETGPQSTREIIGMAIMEAANKAQIAREQMEPEEAYEEYIEAQPVTQQAPPPNGQPLDITALFGRPQMQPAPPFQAPAAANGATGQQLDLLKLFGRPQVQQETHIPNYQHLQHQSGFMNGTFHG